MNPACYGPSSTHKCCGLLHVPQSHQDNQFLELPDRSGNWNTYTHKHIKQHAKRVNGARFLEIRGQMIQVVQENTNRISRLAKGLNQGREPDWELNRIQEDELIRQFSSLQRSLYGTIID